jgi:ribosome-associated translation inhibitor RaiA
VANPVPLHATGRAERQLHPNWQIPHTKGPPMQPTVTPRQMQTIFDVHQYELDDADRRMLEDDLDGLSRQVANFPVADLHILIEGNARNNDVSVKLSLILPGQTLVTNDHDPVLSAAFERCVNTLTDLLKAYKARLDGHAERNKAEKGTAHDVRPTTDIDLPALDAAVAAGDYARFRMILLPFEDAVQARAGRWVQRFPEHEARIGKDVKMSDVTEEIFLTAFDQYDARPEGLPLGEWLEGLIDPSIKALMTRTTEEMENINLARSALNATQPIGRG